MESTKRKDKGTEREGQKDMRGERKREGDEHYKNNVLLVYNNV